jgi:hypothetical protein
MNTGTLLTVSVAALITAAAMVVATLAGSRGPVSVWFYAYSLSPYLAAAWFVLMPWGEKRRQVVSGCVVSVVLLVFTFAMLYDALWEPSSSTGPIALLFLPIYFVVGGAILWPLLYVALKAWQRPAS